MEYIKIIKDKEFPEDESGLRIRDAARAVLFDEKNLIPILFASKYNYHKLPGGGIEKDEDKTRALIRECKEETGCEIEIIKEIGTILEYRSEFNLKQISFCFTGKVISKGEPDFTEKELKEGFKIVWMTLAEAIEQIEKEIPGNYEGKFVQERDLAFLREVEKTGISN